MAGEGGMCYVVVLLCCVFVAHATVPKRKFEYKLSFKGPHLVQQDQSVPFWEHGGSALASDEMIRLTPSLRSKKGYVWSRNTAPYDNWEIEVAVRVSGRGRIGADGMAIWYTKNRGVEGDVFGSNDNWDGLGIFLDSFDNDGQQNNPYIMAITNDGTLQYSHQNDGQNQMLGGCLRDFRNKPFPVRLKIEYYNKAITIHINNGLRQDSHEYEMCMRVENINLPRNGYFGVSAATGGLADDHDVLSFLTHSLLPPVEGAGGQVSEEERQKFEKEFDEYYKELEKAKEDFKTQHPDKAKQDPYDVDEDKWFESQNERELKQIFDGQTNIHMTLKDLNRKLDELLGRQELVLSKLSMAPQGSAGQAPPVHTGQQPHQMGQLNIDTMKRHEVDKVFNNQNDLIAQIRDLRSVVNDVQQRTHTIQASSGGQQQGGGGGGAANQLVFHEIRDNLNNARNDIAKLLTRPQMAPNCPPPSSSSCLTPLVFFIAIAAQFVLMGGYMVYRQNKEAQAKKFY